MNGATTIIYININLWFNIYKTNKLIINFMQYNW